MNAKYQMHLRLRELTSAPATPEYPPIEISEATLGTSVRCLSNYLKTQFVRFSPICVILMTVLYVITQTNCWPYSIHMYVGYEPAGLTVHPPPQNDREWVHFFRMGV